MFIECESSRLIIRKWKKSDYKDLFEYAKDEELTKYLTWQSYTDVQQAKDRIEAVMARYSENGMVNDYAIELKENHKVIGSIGVVAYDEKCNGILEIGYVLSSKYHGNGYMTEALKAVLRFIRDNNMANRIEIKCDVLNEKSSSVMTRAGLTFEGVNRKVGINNHHDCADIAVYSILKEEIIDDVVYKTPRKNIVDIYTDGACSKNPGPGGWAYIIMKGNTKREKSGFALETTNNQMELTAAIKALETVSTPSVIRVHSDSAYLINAFEQGWIEKWKKNRFKNSDKKPVFNLALWKQIIHFDEMHNIKWIKVKGHSDNVYNNRCDELATSEIKKNAPKEPPKPEKIIEEI